MDKNIENSLIDYSSKIAKISKVESINIFVNNQKILIFNYLENIEKKYDVTCFREDGNNSLYFCRNDQLEMDDAPKIYINLVNSLTIQNLSNLNFNVDMQYDFKYDIEKLFIICVGVQSEILETRGYFSEKFVFKNDGSLDRFINIDELYE